MRIALCHGVVGFTKSMTKTAKEGMECISLLNFTTFKIDTLLPINLYHEEKKKRRFLHTSIRIDWH